MIKQLNLKFDPRHSTDRDSRPDPKPEPSTNRPSVPVLDPCLQLFPETKNNLFTCSKNFLLSSLTRCNGTNNELTEITFTRWRFYIEINVSLQILIKDLKWNRKKV